MKNYLTIGAMAALLMPTAAQAQTKPVRQVVAAETAFAAQASQTSTEAALLANSAPNSLASDNGKLANAQNVWRSRPSKPGRKMTWYPVLADAAQSGDLGYTTGPWTQFQNGRPDLAGEYVTVWRKQLDGKWKFAVNMTIERIGSAPAPFAEVPQPKLLPAVPVPSTAPSNVVLDVDSKFAAAELMKPGATYQQSLSSEARLYRPGLSMMLGAAAVANMKNLDGGYLFVANTGYLAAAGDLGYVVGTLHRPASGKHPEENGTYLRIWRREADAGWRIVLEMFNLAAQPTATADAPAGAPATPAPGATGQLPTKVGQ
ncbi:nuclear transport factor 2 family protein [Hymenobacter negativus]|uniref:Nuclear transport factor 2 family protein n=1 Tax=Hymenobacter negativus TaxID=2795026 RepID=A0ABS3QFL5_9BACT|nr:nuclear transport factor 2 family protein [Hymenobacter negativus]MBO2010021.1 nuclear transport factor 2 family protein [Hymenobacter negativus]